MSTLRKLVVTSLIGMWISGSVCSGQEIAGSAPSTPPELGMVLRISDDVFESLIKGDVDYAFPISRCVEGMPVTGNVVATGETSLEIVPSDVRAEFVISVRGVATSNYSVHTKPATASARSVTEFITRKSFVFDGIDFDQAAATADTQTTTCMGQVRPRHRGVVGGVVKKIGKRIASRNRMDINRQVDQAANEYVIKKFEKSGVELESKLDELARFDETTDILLKYIPELADAEYKLSAQKGWLSAGLGPKDAVFPSLPAPKSDVELWIKTRPSEEAFLKIMVEWNLAHDLFKKYLPDEDAKQVSEDLKVDSADGWTVLHLASEQNTAKTSK